MSYTLTELLSAPQAVREVIEVNVQAIKAIARDAKTRGITNITTVARGTSDNAATYFKYMAEIIGGFMVSKYSQSVTTIYNAQINLKKNMILAISQSGMSEDAILVATSAKESGAMTVAVTNNRESKLAKICDHHIYLQEVEEKSIVATKTFLAQMTAMYMLANELSSNFAKMNVSTLPKKLENFLAEYQEGILEFSKQNKDINNFVILSRGMLQGITSEFSLKMMEVAYKFSRPYSTTDFLHGPIAIVEEGTTVVLVAPDSVFREEFVSMATRLSLLGANLIAITDIKEISDIAKSALIMPAMRELETPFIYTMALELISTYVSEELGLNPDAPRNLKKITSTK